MGMTISEYRQKFFRAGVFQPSAAGVSELQTRERILLAAFSEVHRQGYQAASIQQIIDQAGVTKGALYHHFASKRELVLAIIDELHTAYIEQTYIEPLSSSEDPLATLIAIMHQIKEAMTDEELALGCPVDSLAQEVAPIDPEMRHKIEQLYERKHQALVAVMRRGQAAGTVSKAVAPESIALMIMATLQGCMGVAKSAKSVEVLMNCGMGLIHYLELLRVENSG